MSRRLRDSYNKSLHSFDVADVDTDRQHVVYFKTENRQESNKVPTNHNSSSVPKMHITTKAA